MFSKKIILFSILLISFRIYGQDEVVVKFVIDDARLKQGGTPDNITRKFILIKDSTFVAKDEITTELNSKALIIRQHNQILVHINYLRIFFPTMIDFIGDIHGYLTAYRFDDEKELSNDKFVFV
jgi:hypothetical protein